MELDELDRQAAEAFRGLLVRKDLVRQFRGQFPVPTYVVEFMLGRYCATTDEQEIAEGLEVVRSQLSTRTVRAGEDELIKSRSRETGAARVIDIITENGFSVSDRDDLYPDAVPCLERLRRDGFCVAIAANQPAAVGPMLEAMGLKVEFVATSATWGVTKPHPEFFERLTRAADRPPDRIAYVGDRLDNDVLPARRAGMVGVLIRRGPWGHIHATWPERAQADAVIDTLDELPAALGRPSAGPRPR